VKEVEGTIQVFRPSMESISDESLKGEGVEGVSQDGPGEGRVGRFWRSPGRKKQGGRVP